MIHLIIPFLCCLICTSFAVTLEEFLFENQPPQRLSKSIALANKEKDRILSLMAEVNGLALVLPTDAAWNKMPGVFDALYNGNKDELVRDVLLSTAVEMNVAESSSWENVKRYAEANEVIDTAYGASFMIGDARGSVCVAKWSNGRYESGSRCIELELPPTVLQDGAVYFANGLLFSDDLYERVANLV